MQQSQPYSGLSADVNYFLREEYDGLRVLLVEDDIADTYLIKNALQCDRRVDVIRHASDGIAALELLRDGAFVPDLAIIDLHMPRKDGFSLLVELGCWKDIIFPKFVLTSSIAHADMVRSHLRGADLVLTKPNTLQELKVLLYTAVSTV